MPKSPAFIQIKAAVLEITTKIPAGQVTTYGAIGNHLNIMARHVAYILAMLAFEEQEEVPWYRVVGEQGAIAPGKLNARHLAQIEYLQQEGVRVTPKNRIENFETIFCPPSQLVDWDYSTKCYE